VNQTCSSDILVTFFVLFSSFCASLIYNSLLLLLFCKIWGFLSSRLRGQVSKEIFDSFKIYLNQVNCFKKAIFTAYGLGQNCVQARDIRRQKKGVGMTSYETKRVTFVVIGMVWYAFRAYVTGTPRSGICVPLTTCLYVVLALAIGVPTIRGRSLDIWTFWTAAFFLNWKIEEVVECYLWTLNM
jgi:hypothetical protein